MFYVSEYEVTREYGGPEEGGWYYDWYEFVRVMSPADSEGSAAHLASAMNNAHNVTLRLRDPDFHDRYSVLGGADTVFLYESVPGEEASTEVPFYC